MKTLSLTASILAFAAAMPAAARDQIQVTGSSTVLPYATIVAEAFGEIWNIPRRYGGYEALLADDDIQAVYISTPHPSHAEWAIKAANW